MADRAGPHPCWVLTTGESGMRSQALGLAEAVGLPFVEKRIVVRRPWSALPGGLLPMPVAALDPAGDRLQPPWPQLVVACGRRSIGPALAVKRLSRGQTLAAYIQNPELGRRKFDLVAAMPHDGVAGPNVMSVDTALNQVTPERLQAAQAAWRGRLGSGRAPLIGVLLGGDNGGYRLTAEIVERLARILANGRRQGFCAYLTPSRRTGAVAINRLKELLGPVDGAGIWDGAGENPYFGILALSERLIVTGESISMISEALATGRPVHILPLQGRARRHDAFLKRVEERGLVSKISGDEIDWSFLGGAPVNATPAVAARLRAMLQERSGM